MPETHGIDKLVHFAGADVTAPGRPVCGVRFVHAEGLSLILKTVIMEPTVENRNGLRCGVNVKNHLNTKHYSFRVCIVS
jgi:hypothetical protein